MKNGPQTASTLSGQMSEMGRNGSVAGFTTRAIHPSGADMPRPTRHLFVGLWQPAGESVVAGAVSLPPDQRLPPGTTALLATTLHFMQMGDRI